MLRERTNNRRRAETRRAHPPSCLFDNNTSKPCLPNKISFIKLIIITQMIGDTSTPPTGGTNALVGLSNGSVGAYASTHGNLVYGTLGYHVMTIRTMNKIVLTANNGPKTALAALAPSGSNPDSCPYAAVDAFAASTLVAHVNAPTAPSAVIRTASRDTDTTVDVSASTDVSVSVSVVIERVILERVILLERILVIVIAHPDALRRTPRFSRPTARVVAPVAHVARAPVIILVVTILVIILILVVIIVPIVDE